MLCFLPSGDTSRPCLVTVTCIHRNNQRCAQENTFDTVDVGAAAAKKMSPNIDVQTLKDGVALFQDKTMQHATGVDKGTQDVTLWRPWGTLIITHIGGQAQFDKHHP